MSYNINVIKEILKSSLSTCTVHFPIDFQELYYSVVYIYIHASEQMTSVYSNEVTHPVDLNFLSVSDSG